MHPPCEDANIANIVFKLKYMDYMFKRSQFLYILCTLLEER